MIHRLVQAEKLVLWLEKFGLQYGSVIHTAAMKGRPPCCLELKCKANKFAAPSIGCHSPKLMMLLSMLEWSVLVMLGWQSKYLSRSSMYRLFFELRAAAIAIKVIELSVLFSLHRWSRPWAVLKAMNGIVKGCAATTQQQRGAIVDSEVPWAAAGRYEQPPVFDCQAFLSIVHLLMFERNVPPIHFIILSLVDAGDDCNDTSLRHHPFTCIKICMMHD
jgi:hypothetical protein